MKKAKCEKCEYCKAITQYDVVTCDYLNKLHKSIINQAFLRPRYCGGFSKKKVVRIMAECNDCIHYDMCLLGACVDGKTGTCLYFKNKADVQEVVRCCDCEYLNILNSGHIFAMCKKTNYRFLPFQTDTRTHFCSFGKRKEVD